MDHWKDFTFDPVTYPLHEMQRFVSALVMKGMKWIPIIDPGIKVEPGYLAYEKGLHHDVFLRSLVDGGKEPYLGWVWAGPSLFPDFLSKRVREDYYIPLLETHHAMVPWDGLWIDMNEASNFCTGDACTAGHATVQRRKSRRKSGPRDKTPNAPRNNDTTAAGLFDPEPWMCQLDCSRDITPSLNQSMKALLHPPYAVSNSLVQLPLGTKAISVVAMHLDGELQYNTHNIYCLAQSMATYKAILSAKQGKKRPFILSRSTFTGAGAYVAHWSGDNAATWTDLARSIPAILNYGLFGMPMAGVDVCGFQGTTTEELCARWIALAAVGYPFARSHSDRLGGYQEPYRWRSVAEVARKTLSMRYSMLPYYYTLARMASAVGAPVARPMWMNYPRNKRVHRLDAQFFVGDALLVAPVLRQGATEVRAYFPGGTTWYDMFEEESPIDATHLRDVDQGMEVTVRAPLLSIPVYLKGGSVIAMQQPGMTTSQVRGSDITLVVALPHRIVDGHLMMTMHHNNNSNSNNKNSKRDGSGTTGRSMVEDSGHTILSHAARKLQKKIDEQHILVDDSESSAFVRQTAQGSMYHDSTDDAECLHGCESCCNFLSFEMNTTSMKKVVHDMVMVSHQGVLEIRHALPGYVQGKDNNGHECDAGCAAVEWPRIRKVKVMGWTAGLVKGWSDGKDAVVTAEEICSARGRSRTLRAMLSVVNADDAIGRRGWLEILLFDGDGANGVKVSQIGECVVRLAWKSLV